MFEERSTDAFREGHNCAQSVISSFQDDPRFGHSITLMHGASLGSGIANSGCICGVLSGSLLLINAYVATLELESGASQKLADELSSTLLDKFKSDYGSTCCRVIKRNQNLDTREARSGCTQMVGDITVFLNELIEEHQAFISSHAARRIAVVDIPASGRRIAQALLAGLTAGAAVGALVALVASLPSWWPYLWLALGAILATASATGRGAIRIARSSLTVTSGALAIIVGVVLFAGVDSLAFARLSAAYSQIGFIISLAVAFVAVLILFLVRIFETVRFGL